MPAATSSEEPTGPEAVVAAASAGRPADPAPAGRPADAAPPAGPDDATPAGRPADPAHAGEGVAAFFDVDNTIIRGASSFHLARALYARGFFSTRDLLSFAVHQARYLVFGENREQIDEVRSRALSIMAGHSVAEITAIGEEVYDTVLALRVFPGTKRLLEAHLEAGHQVWLVSATPVEIGDLIARRLGATGALGTIAEHAQGFYTGRLVGDMMHGKAKAAAVRRLAEHEGLDLARCYAYGDSTNDVAVLSAVGNPCAINPDTRLRRHARTVGWPIREFRGNSRFAKPGLRTASLAGGAWVASLVWRSVTRALRSRLP